MPLENDTPQIAGHPAEEARFVHGRCAVSFYRVARLEERIDRAALLRDDVVPDPPYWAHPWVGARALARFVVDGQELRGLRVLDLGCGLGLCGLVAAACGADVWFADREPAALEFVRASARRNGLSRIRTLEIDFTTAELATRFDLILAAEVVYEPSSYEPLARFLDLHLAASGVVHLTDAFRSDARTFFEGLARRGFRGERRPWREWEEGRPQGLFLWTFRRSG